MACFVVFNRPDLLCSSGANDLGDLARGTCAANRRSLRHHHRRDDLVVVSPGVLPQRLLRYQLAKGTKSTVELEVEGKLVAGEITPSAAPPLMFALENVVDDVLADGHMKLTTTILELTTHAAPDQPGDAGGDRRGRGVEGLQRSHRRSRPTERSPTSS